MAWIRTRAAHPPLACSSIVAALIASSQPCHASPPTIHDVHAMQKAVEEEGLIGFAGVRQTNGWQAPVIPSAWYVANVSPATEKPYYEAARGLGSALLASIDAWAPAMRADDPAAALAKATTLVDLAYWLGGTEGYANLLLAERARDVALTGLARRVADLGVSLEDTAQQVQRCHAAFDAAPVRARVLNFEAGEPLFPAGATVTDGDLAGVWSPRQLSRTLAELNQQPTGPTPNEVSGAMQQLRDWIAALGFKPLPAQSSDVFFRDDEVPPPNTIRSSWSSKQHQRLLASTTPQNVYPVEMLIQFRSVVGEFPTQPELRQETISSPGEEAFAKAWRPHIGSATFNLGRPAWSIYDRIQHGEFLDDDSAHIRMALALTPPSSKPSAAPSTSAATSAP